MSAGSKDHGLGHQEFLSLYALRSLPEDEVPAVEARIAACAECQRELATLAPVLDAIVSWPTDVLRPPASLWERLASRIGPEASTSVSEAPALPPEPEWAEAAPGLYCKVLAADEATGRVSLLVRLDPGGEYPPHVHAGIEELWMLHGDLLVNDKKLHAGDYLRSEPETEDHRVWSESGCTGILVTSSKDILR